MKLWFGARQRRVGVTELDTHYTAGPRRLLVEEEEGVHQKKLFSAMWVLEIGQELRGCGRALGGEV